MKCLFCGKPLSRISLRREGDFCCREHRDRYHLRQGLNRVEEAHQFQVAARRRECPNAMRLDRPAGLRARPRVAAGDLPTGPRSPHHGFPPAVRAGALGLECGAPMARRPQPGEAAGRRAAAGPPAIRPPLALPRTAAPLHGSTAGCLASAPPRFHNPAVPAAAGSEMRRPFPARMPARLETRLPRAAGAPLRPAGVRGISWEAPAAPLDAAPAAVSRRWETCPVGDRAVRCASGPPFPRTRTARRRSPAGTGFAAALEGRMAPAAARRACPAAPGLALGTVAWGAGSVAAPGIRAAPGFPAGESLATTPPAFVSRPRVAAPVPFKLPAAAPASAAWPRGAGFGATPQRAGAFQIVRLSGRPAGASRMPVCPVPMVRREPAFPVFWSPLERSRPAPAPFLPVRLNARDQGPVKQSGSRFQGGSAWLGALPVAQPPLTPELSGRRRTPPFAPRPVTAGWSTGCPSPRPAALPFAAGRAMFPPASLGLLGTVTGALVDTRSGAAFHLEDNFDAGLARWAGGSADWRLDAAGVRPRSLALFAPSLEARDYVLEFLAKLEHGGMSWIFRARDMEHYYACRLALVQTPAGLGFEMSRRAVIGGVPEAPVVVPLPFKPRSRAAFRVETRAVGNGIATSLDGQIVDSWTDDRLPAGGIGFMADGDARARLYWVKLHSPARRGTETNAGHRSPEPHGPDGSHAA